MKIGAKLGAGFGGIILLLTVLGIIGIWQLKAVNSGYQDNVLVQDYIQIHAMEIVANILEVRRSEKDFIARRDIAYFKRGLKYTKEAIVQAEMVGKASTLEPIHLELDKITKAMSRYQEIFGQLAKAYEARGFTEKDGLRGKFRTTVQGLGKILTENEVAGGEILYLSLRKEEKDYMIHKDAKYVSRLDSKRAELLDKVRADQSLSQTIKNTIEDAANSYSNNFHRLVDKDIEIGKLLAEMKVAADLAMKHSKSVEGLASNEAQRVTGDITKKVDRAITYMWLLIALSTVGATVFAVLFGRSIARPMGQTVKMIEELGNGHLDMRLNIKRDDEIGQLAMTMDNFADSLQNEIVTPLTQLAQGDLTFSVTTRDEHDVVRGALQKVGVDLNSVINNMNEAGNQVAVAANQVSSASQSLSQGATEQASSLEQISSSMTELSSQTKANAENANQANQLSSVAMEAAQQGNGQMQEMVSAMKEINQSSEDISKIIKVIDEIAFQTNLLALNAAVEAARAGSHGKGFAVVAEEVRNLAARSASAARETAQLIEGSVTKTGRGTDIANQTASALEEIVGSITKVSDLVAEIAASSTEQAQGIAEIDIGISQIDKVTQQNTASAEQSAAASEELSAQADELRDMLDHFRLRGKTTSRKNTPPALPSPPKGPAKAPIRKAPGISHHRPAERSQPKVDEIVLPPSKSPAKEPEIRPEEIIALDDSEFGRY